MVIYFYVFICKKMFSLQLSALFSSQQRVFCFNNLVCACVYFLAYYFREGSSDLEDSELRFATCQSLQKQVKSETEVSLAPNTKAAFCIYNSSAYFFFIYLFITCLNKQFIKAIKEPEILTQDIINIENPSITHYL